MTMLTRLKQMQQLTCDLCGGPVLKRQCKIVCTVCGFMRDCGDPVKTEEMTSTHSDSFSARGV